MITQLVLSGLSGSVVGFTLGLIGGGGSILAVPLIIYVVGVNSPHIAIGTSAFAVGANALGNFIGHWRRGNVVWPHAAIFAVAGIVGAAAGSTLGKLIDGRKLLIFFALAMVAVAFAMLRPQMNTAERAAPFDRRIAARLIGLGLLTGAASGFFGIGGGFLIVPALMFGGSMPILGAVGSSLLSVGAFGLTTAANYALSGLIAWHLGIAFIAGGILGGVLGIRLAIRLGAQRSRFARVFAGFLFAVAAYMVFRTVRDF